MLHLQIIFIDSLIDRLRPVDLVIFTLLLELLDLNLNATKGDMEFLGKWQLKYM